MLETWELIRHITEVLGMVFIPMVGWILITLTQHSKKIILLEERVNETINSRLNTLEKHLNIVNSKVDRNHELINKISNSIGGCKVAIDDKDKKLDLILDQIKKIS